MPRPKTINAIELLEKMQGEKNTLVLKGYRTFGVNATKLLLWSGALRPIVKTWYMSSLRVSESEGLWASSFWEFVAKFAEFHFGSNWCLSELSSACFLSKTPTLPLSVTIYANANLCRDLPFERGRCIVSEKREIPECAYLDRSSGMRLVRCEIASPMQWMRSEWGELRKQVLRGEFKMPDFAAKALWTDQGPVRILVAEAIKRLKTGEPAPKVLKGAISLLHYHIFKGKNALSFRTHRLFYSSASFSSLPPLYIADCLDTLYELVEAESDNIVRSILAYYFYMYISPYSTGNEVDAEILSSILSKLCK